MSRATCSQCLRPMVACWCHCIQTLNHQGKVVIWQHPNESGHPKGTALLLHHCLKDCSIWVGETSSPENIGIDLNNTWLVYPANPKDAPAPPSKNTEKPPTTLLLLDGTWRKSRKLFYSNPWLQRLPKLSLASQLSHYAIRKSESPHQLSTFEAACLGLHQHHLMNDAAYATSQSVFKAFIEHANHLKHQNS